VFWPLMKDCITKKDRKRLVEFVTTASRFTNGPQVREFEKQWSQWLGCDYSLFVSSGSTANLLLVSAIKEKYNLKSGKEKNFYSCIYSFTIRLLFKYSSSKLGLSRASNLYFL